MGRDNRRHQLPLGAQARRARREPKGSGPLLLLAVAAAAIVFVCAGTAIRSGGGGQDDATVWEAQPAGTYDAQVQFAALGQTPSLEDDGLVDACAEILERHQGTSGCTLVFAGYLDLFGNVWACLVSGQGWAEIDVVRAQEGGSPHVSQTRIDASVLQALAGDAP